MPGDNLFFLFSLLVAAAASGAWLALRIAHRGAPAKAARQRFSPDYFKGLNYLLNEQPDKAIEVFIRMAEVDNETVETHFALGNLFRRRGEVARAIRIHQNIIARPNLDRRQRDQALFALAEDYQKAGLFDRAEKLFLQLCAVPGQRQRAMASLIRIYELQKDWAQAIEVRRKLGANSSTDADGGAAHAYCELAQQAIDAGDLAGARSHLRKARVNGTQLLRSAYMRAQVAEVQNDFRSATKLYRGMIEDDESFAIEVLPRLMHCLRAVGGDEKVTKSLRRMLIKQPDLNQLFALAALTHGEYDDPVIMGSLRKFFAADGFAAQVVAAVADTDVPQVEHLSDQQLRRICTVLSDLISNRYKYECRECGYSGNVLYWQCPGCKNWDTTRPITRLIGGGMRSAV